VSSSSPALSSSSPVSSSSSPLSSSSPGSVLSSSSPAAVQSIARDRSLVAPSHPSTITVYACPATASKVTDSSLVWEEVEPPMHAPGAQATPSVTNRSRSADSPVADTVTDSVTAAVQLQAVSGPE